MCALTHEDIQHCELKLHGMCCLKKKILVYTLRIIKGKIQNPFTKCEKNKNCMRRAR